MNSPYLHPKFKQLEKEYDSVVQCNRCGFCETVCPTYVVSGKETLSPRGRNQAFRQILEGKIEKPAQAAEIFSTCLTCHACTDVCFSEVPVAKLMGYARAVSRAKERPTAMEILLFRFFLRYRKFLSFLLWNLFLLKRLKLSRLLLKAGILKRISPELAAGETLIDRAPLWFGAGPPEFVEKMFSSKVTRLEASPPSSAASHPLYFSGCGIHYLYPEISMACVNILRALHENVTVPNHSCCGLPAYSAGDIEGAEKLAKRNVNRLQNSNPTAIVVNDDSCCGFMKSYGEFLGGDLKAVSFSRKIKNMAEFLLDDHSFREREQRGLSLHSQRGNCRVAYHDPCQMGNAHHQFSQPREILKQIRGIDFVEMEESNWCCGGAGTYCLKHPRLAEDVLERKLFNIKQSGAEIVVTQASSCLLHLQYGFKKKGWENKIRVTHLAEFLWSPLDLF